MARNTDLTPGYTENNIILASPITPRANAPLDDRLVVANYDALTNANSFDSIYPGMAVALADTGELYVYAGPESLAGAQVSSNWKKVGDFSSDIADLEQKIQDVSDKSIKKDIVNSESSIYLVDSTKSPGKAYVQIDDGFGRGSSATYLYPQFIGFAYSEGDSLAIKNDLSGSLKLGKLDPDEKSTFLDEAVKITNVKVPTQNLDAANKKYVDDQDATTLSAAKKYADEKVSSAYKIKGCKDNFTDLTETGNQSGDVWNIKNAFTLDGKPYPAGTNVVWVEAHTDGEDTDHASGWDALGGTIDLSPYLKIEDAGKNFKSKQTAVAETGAADKTLTISQNSNGEITAKAVNIEIAQGQVTGLDADLINLNDAVTAAQSTADAAKTTAEAAVPKTTTVNGKSLKENITLAAADVAHGLTGTSVIKTTDTNTTVKTALTDLDTKAKSNSDRIDKLEGATKNIVSQIVVGDASGDDEPANLTGSVTFDYNTEDQEIEFRQGAGNVILANIKEGSIAFEKLDEGVQTSLQYADSALQSASVTHDNYINLSAANDGNQLKLGVALNVAGDFSDNNLTKATVPNTAAVKTYVDNQLTAKAGVTSVGGKTGAITVDGTGSGSYPVKLAMTNNALGATISGLGTAAAKAVGDFATAAQGTKADGAVQLGKENSSGENATSFVVDAVTDTGIIVKTKTGATVSSTAKLSPRMLQVGDGQASRLIPGALVLSNKEGEDVYISSASAGHITVLSGGSTNTTVIGGVATPTDGNDAANKAYVDSALTWEVL